MNFTATLLKKKPCHIRVALRVWDGSAIMSTCFPTDNMHFGLNSCFCLNKKGVTMRCDQCDSCYINGVFCHEHGCPSIEIEDECVGVCEEVRVELTDAKRKQILTKYGYMAGALFDTNGMTLVELYEWL